MSDTKRAAGVVMPAGTLRAADVLPPGNCEVVIDGFDESGLARLVYPGGFVKHHQASTVEELAGKVVNQLRGRYGADGVEFVSVPAEVAPGEAFIIKG
jgi:hypothetical protein